MKKGALELSIGTIIIIVLAVIMLILGIVFVRGIMCAGIGLTGEINSKVRGEIEKLFESYGGEVQCVGAGTEAVKIIPDEVNIIYCSIDAGAGLADYEIKVTDYNGETLQKSKIESWVIGEDEWKGPVSPGDKEPKKIVRLNVPSNAPEELITMRVEVRKKGAEETSYELISTKDLDFKISRKGFIKAAIC